MLIESEKRGVFEEMLIIVSALSAMDVRERPQGKEERADERQAQFLDERSDFGVFLNLWRGIGEFREGGKLKSNQLRKWCERNFISYRRVREWLGVYAELRRSFKKAEAGKLAAHVFFRTCSFVAAQQGLQKLPAAHFLFFAPARSRRRQTGS